MSKCRILCVIGAAAIVLGALLPWASIQSVFGTINKAGFLGDGLYTGGVGVALLLFAVVRTGKPGRVYSILAVLVALAVGVVAIMDIAGVSQLAENDNEYAVTSVGAGLYITLVGAVAVIIGGLMRTPAPAVATLAPE